MAGVLCLGGLASCSETDSLTWQFEFASDALRQRAVGVAAEVRQGGCRGRTLFTTWISRDGASSAPGNLDDGVYGFYGRARDDRCNFFAEGCTEVTVPTRETVNVLLEESGLKITDPTCATNPDIDDVTGTDAGEPELDAAEPDEPDAGAGPGDGDGDGDDAGQPTRDAGEQPLPEPDAGQPEEDASAPALVSQCESLDSAVVACFDFNGSLDDASSFGNDATGTAAYEAGLFGQALRADGRPIVVQNDTSLNVDELTVEVWMRPDSLVNLFGESNNTSIVVDKDQQYNVAFESNGEPVGQIYAGVDDTRSVTAEVAPLTSGAWVILAFTYDGSMARLYRNGELVDQRRHDVDLFGGNGGTMHIGSGSPSATRAFDGLIDALRISNVARGATEICAAAGKTFSGGSCD